MHWLVAGTLLVSGTVFAAGNAPTLSAPRPYAVEQLFSVGGPGDWDCLTVDPTAARLFIARADKVLIVNTADGTLTGSIPDTAGVHAVAIAADLNKGFTSNGRSDTVTVFDLTSLKTTATLAVKGHGPDAILYDDASGNLYTFNGLSHDVSVIDPTRGGTIATIPVGGKPEFAIADGAGHIYVNIEDKSQIVTIDSLSSRRIATWSLPECEEPTGLALDVAHHRLFSACGNAMMAVTDASSGKHVSSVPIGHGTDGAVFDAERRLVFSANGADGTLSVIHEDDPDHYSVMSTVTTQKSARTLALDPKSHRLYLAAAEFGSSPVATNEQPKPRAPVIDGSFKVLVVGN